MVDATSPMKQAESRAHSVGASGGDSRVFDWPAIGVLQTMATAMLFTLCPPVADDIARETDVAKANRAIKCNRVPAERRAITACDG
jgi:hypothetical protein